MTERELIFVLPAQSDAISGGNLYNRHLIEALARIRAVRVLSVAEGLATMAAGAPGVYFIDTVNLADFLGSLAERNPQQQRILVVHLLPSMRLDLAPTDPSLAIERAALPRFDGFLTTSAYTSALLRDRGVTTQAILTVPPALTRADRPALACPARMRGVMVGNLLPGKRVLAFLEELAAAVTGADDFDIDLIGRTDMDPGYADACGRVIASSPVLARAVHVHGGVPYEAMDDCYRRASALISASEMESFGMALQEARAWGLPILACDAGNVRNHFEHGVNGELFGTIPALVAGVLDLVRHPARMQALFARAQAMRLAGDYTWNEAAHALLRALDTELGRPRA